GHHDTEDLSAVYLGKGLGHQRNADDDFSSGADPGKEAIDPKLEGRVRQPLQPGKHAVDQDAERQSSDTPDIVRYDAEQKASRCPAEQPDSAEETADPTDLRNRRLPAQELGQSRTQHEREEAEISGVKRPAGPDDKENQPLVAGKTPDKSQL